MATIIQGSAYRSLLAGVKVTEPAAALPQTATGNIFTITGGRVLLTSLTGMVTVATGAVATTLTVGLTPTSGTAAPAGLAAATAITSREVGTLLALPATAGGALVVGANAGGPVQTAVNNPYVLEPGTITITTNASNTGSVQWDLTYVPLDDGASVAAV